eukprot:366520-Chlamydomonas_euryale.AAC.17
MQVATRQPRMWGFTSWASSHSADTLCSSAWLSVVISLPPAWLSVVISLPPAWLSVVIFLPQHFQLLPLLLQVHPSAARASPRATRTTASAASRIAVAPAAAMCGSSPLPPPPTHTWVDMQESEMVAPESSLQQALHRYMHKVHIPLLHKRPVQLAVLLTFLTGQRHQSRGHSPPGQGSMTDQRQQGSFSSMARQ